MTCLCTDDTAFACCGGGLPRDTDGACSCPHHRPVLRWPLATPMCDPVRRAALDLRVMIYAAAASAAEVPCVARIPHATAIAHELASWPAAARDQVLTVLGAEGLAVPLVGAFVRLSLAVARARQAQAFCVARER